MKANILTGSEKTSRALKRYMVYVMGFKERNCQIMLFGQASGLSPDNLKAELWMIETWHPFEPDNPEGFRTAYKLAGRSKFLLLFYDVPEGFPEDGFFWCNPITCDLNEKITEAIDNPPPTKAEFDQLIKLWPALAHEPKDHHH